MTHIVEWIKLIGGLAGLAALAWRVVDEFGTYLRISVKAETPNDGWVTILTTVDNGAIVERICHTLVSYLGRRTRVPL